MCGRFTIRTPLAELADEFDLDDAPAALEPRFNVAPTQTAPIVRERDERRALSLVRWGLVPPWARDLKAGARMINARSETAATQPAFRKAFAQRRCLVLADGFYEWRRVGKARFPLHIRRPDGRPFAMAGLWERWRGRPDGRGGDDDRGDGPWIETCTVLTTTANRRVSEVHDRMPALLLDPDAIARWLDLMSETADLQSLLRPSPDDALELTPVSTVVNDVRNDGPQCLGPFEPAPTEALTRQLDLFGD